ncbi:hypothetical protein RA28_10850 [Ruegeria sp. ANG-S4]|nr:hypothetical protein RA28_10850 [Ruegeria sp. ANG-S4]
MNYSQRLGFVAGVVDRDLAQTTDGDETGHNQRAEIESECLSDLAVTTVDLVQPVDERYQDIEKWEWPSFAIVLNVIYELCKNRL